MSDTPNQDLLQGETPNAAETYDKKHGKYEDVVAKVPQKDLLQESQMPKGTDPSPFTVGPMTPSGR
jgi:hypothetical protein